MTVMYQFTKFIKYKYRLLQTLLATLRVYDFRDIVKVYLSNGIHRVRVRKLPLTILVRSREDIRFLEEMAFLLNANKCNHNYYTLLKELGIVLEGNLESSKELLRIVKNLNLALRRKIILRKHNVAYEACFSFKGRRVILTMPLLSLFELDEIFFEEVYYDNVIKEGIVVDIGAYIGDSSIYFALKGAKKVIAFEPLKHYFEFLVMNIKLNNFSRKIVAYNNAVLDYEGETFMLDHGPSSKIHAKGNIRVACRDIANILFEIWKDHGQIDLMKIDCEGCEVRLLKRMIMKNAIKPYRIVIETHGTFNKVRSLLGEMGYKIRIGKRRYIVWGLLRV